MPQTFPADPPAGLSREDDLDWRRAIALLAHIQHFHDQPPTAPAFPARVIGTGQEQINMAVKHYVVVGGFTPPVETDVALRRHFTSVGGVDQPPADTPVDQDFYQVAGLDVGAELTYTYAYVDQAGNESGRSPALTHTVSDSTPPTAPSGSATAILATGQYEEADGPPPYEPPLTP